MEIKPKVIILVGTPMSGKSSFRDEYMRKNPCFNFICRDHFRVVQNKGSYPKWNKEFENKINRMVASATKYDIDKKINTIIDETNCKTGKILSWINKFKDTHEIYIVVFNEPMYKLLYRNIKRYLFGGERKWIPIKVIRQMKDNFNKIDWNQIMKENVIFSTPQNMLG